MSSGATLILAMLTGVRNRAIEGLLDGVAPEPLPSEDSRGPSALPEPPHEASSAFPFGLERADRLLDEGAVYSTGDQIVPDRHVAHASLRKHARSAESEA